MDLFKTAVHQWSPMSVEEWEPFRALFRPRHVQSGAFVTLPGDDAHELLFVQTGLLRFYYLTPDGKESNKAFVTAGEFAGPLASAELDLPLYFGIEALEETRLLTATFTDLRALYPTAVCYERFGRKLAESLLTRKELRMRSLLEQSATERYLSFAQQHPTLIERVPQYHIATYLGITEVSLSRIKRDLRETAVST